MSEQNKHWCGKPNTIAFSLNRGINSSSGIYKRLAKDGIRSGIHDYRNKKLKESIGCLNPFVGDDGLIRVGGRLQQPNLDEKIIHTVMLPKKGKLAEIIIRYQIIIG